MQGEQGLPGMLNVSQCTHKSIEKKGTVIDRQEMNARVTLHYAEPQVSY